MISASSWALSSQETCSAKGAKAGDSTQVLSQSERWGLRMVMGWGVVKWWERLWMRVVRQGVEDVVAAEPARKMNG